jgi:hypothetical protein
MALRFLDSCAHYGTGDVLGKWTAQSSCLVVDSGGRWGGRFLRRWWGYCKRTFDAQDKWYLAFALRIDTDASSNIVLVMDGSSDQVELIQQPGCKLAVTRNFAPLLGPTQANIYSLGSWFHIQFYVRIHSTAGEVTVKVNGTTVLSGVGLNTQATGHSYADVVRFDCGALTHDLQDIWIADGTGSVNNSLPGDLRVHALVPNGSGTYAEWTPTAGANWGCVDEIPPNGDTDYVRTDAAGARDAYAFSDIPDPGAIKGVQMNLWARKDDAQSRVIRSLVRIGGNDYFGADKPLADSYRDEMQIFDSSPATGLAWTRDEINGAEFGAQMVS